MAKLLSILIQLFILVSNIEATLKSSYGEPCHKGQRCDSRGFLTCFENRCQCLMPDTMTYEERSRKCVGLAGEKCVYRAYEAESSWTEEVPCTFNANCVEGRCVCSSQYFELANGTCASKRNYGEPCETSEMCRDDLFLECGVDGHCKCDDDHLYEEFQGKCVTLAGQTCERSLTICVSNSDCNTDRYPYRCTCDDGYFQTSNGTCEERKNYGGKCTDDSQCKLIPLPGQYGQSFLKCTKGRCECNPAYSLSHDSMYFDEHTVSAYPVCKIRVGSRCQNSYSSTECVPNAVCENGPIYDLNHNVYDYNYGCRCIGDFYESKYKTCESKKLHGVKCDADKECLESKMLECRANRCDCKSGFVLDPDSLTCVSAAGATCSQYQSCVPNAKCIEKYNPRNGYDEMICHCQNGTKEFSGYCHVYKGDLCSGDMYGDLKRRTCLPGLVCRDDVCSCPYKDHQRYDISFLPSPTCHSVVGGPCNASQDCIVGAECIEESGIGVCRCKNGFTPVDRVCDLAYGENCTQGQIKHKCDRAGPLGCSKRGLCECSDFQTYDKENLKCLGLFGAKCNVNTDKFCTNGTVCKAFRSVYSHSFDGTGVCICKPGLYLQTDRSCAETAAHMDTTTWPALPSISESDNQLMSLHDTAGYVKDAAEE